MDHRPGLGPTRPPPPQRSASGSYSFQQQGLRRNPIPSRLTHVRSFSQPATIVDLTSDRAKVADVRNTTAFLSNGDTVYTSPDVINLDDEDNERPAKRAKTSGHGFRTADGGNANAEAGRATAYKAVSGSPLPPLRKQNVSANNNMVQSGRRAVVSRTARRANGIEPPSIATRLPAPKNVADFSPWNGQHPEDIMSETVVKAGYYDKAPGLNSTESNSAKPTIWPNLSQKNNMGLQTLSYLFTSVMEKRAAMGKCTAPSTFKPPPRVTVTDTKREAWLRDLANPSVPLRKQSRTIPHGIRGKLLMEQCLGKDIPMPRAVWLAKCVGANELRAFRRKGVSGAAAASGESKWIREWTVHVEMFLEGIVATCGQPEWQKRMDYAVKLATSFYAERLLESNHYLDWIVTCFSQAPIDRLPIWTILVQLYWKDITAFGRRGRRLAEAILETLHQITLKTLQANESLKDRLKKLVVIMAVTNRGCLIIPRTWERYKHLLVPTVLPERATPLNIPAQNISKRNNRLTGPLHKTPQNTRSAIVKLYSMLDTVGLSVDIEKLTSTCLATVPDTQRLVAALLSWSASVYRTGLSRIFLVAKLVAQLYIPGHDIDGAILDYLKTAKTNSIIVENVHRVIAELVREASFSTGRYLQWLITSGALSGAEGLTMATGLLTALPIDALPAHLLNTRQMLVRRLRLVEEDRVISIVEASVHSATMLYAEPLQQQGGIKALSGSAKLEIARRISTKAIALAKEYDMTLQCFCISRKMLEECNDIPTLAEVIQAAMYADDAMLLATVADTLNMHAKAFAAIGHLPSALHYLLERYRTLRTHKALERSFILALAALVKRFPDRTQFLRLLENDLAICEQQTSMVVCSPASDNLVSMQASSLDSDNDIDAVFASGNTMDEQLMQRVFSRIAQRAGKATQPDEQAPSKICGWLNQLRAVDPTNFDQTAKNYIQACLKTSGESITPCKVISALVASGCMPFDVVLDLANETKLPNAASTAIRLLVSKNVVNDGLHAIETFRYQVQQKRYLRDSAAKIIPLLATAMDDPNFDVDDEGTMKLVLDYTVNNRDEGTQIFPGANPSSTFVAACGRLTTKILNLGRASGSRDIQLSAASIIELADPLSIDHCVAALAFYSKLGTFADNDGNTGMQSAILNTITKGSDVWPPLLEGAGQEMISSIHHWAQEQVLNTILRPDALDSPGPDEVHRFLDILDVAHHATKEDDNGPIIAAVTEKLKTLENLLSTFEVNEAGEQEKAILMRSLQVLLHLSVLYCASKASANETLNQSRCNLLATLCALLVHPKLQSQQQMLEYIHDVASALADNLPEETLPALAKSASAKDARLASVLGSSKSPDAWLALASYPQPQGTHQQRALMKQAGGPSQQAMPGARQGPPSLIQQQPPNLSKTLIRSDGRLPSETKQVPYPLRHWEIMPDATPMVGDNDTSLSLSLFGARKV